MSDLHHPFPVPAADQHWNLDAIVAELRQARLRWRGAHGRLRELRARELPSREALAQIVQALCGALFPMRLGPPDLRDESEDYYVGHTLDAALNALLAQVRLELAYQARQQGRDSARAEADAVDSCAASPPACPASAVCSTATWWPPSRATRRPAAWTKCCSATRAWWR